MALLPNPWPFGHTNHLTRSGPSNRAKITVCAIALVLPVAVAEIYLRAIDYETAKSPIEIIVGDRIESMANVTETDSDAFWVMKRAGSVELAGYTAITNELGSRDPIVDPSARDAIRILCVGDSTCFGNHTTWPRELERVLRDAVPHREIHTVNGGVLGYSSYQSLQLFKHRLVDLDPDIVIFCFGFNDSWPVARGQSDVELAAAGRTIASKIRRTFRTAQWIDDLGGENGDGQADPAVDGDGPVHADMVPRVSPEQFTSVLEELVEICRSRDAIPIGLTQPHAFPARGSTTRPTLPPGLARRRDDHDDHNLILRDTCERLDVSCLDLADLVADLPSVDLVNDPYPGKDSIHQNPLGYRVWGEEIAAHLLRLGIVKGAPADSTVPAFPRFRVRASILAAESIDLDHTGTERLVLSATLVPPSGTAQVRLLSIDPLSKRSLEIPTQLPTPDAPVSIEQVYALGNAFVITAPSGDDDGGVTLVITGVGGKPIAPPMSLSLGGEPDLRIRSVELDGDRRPEYAVSFGPNGRNQIVLLDDRLRIFRRRPRLNLPTQVGAFVHSGRISIGDAPRDLVPAESLLVGARNAKWAGAMSYGQVNVFQPAHLRMKTQPLQLIAGQFDAETELDELLALRHAALATFDHDKERFDDPWFPLGALRYDPAIPPIALTRVRTGQESKLRLFAASRVGDLVTVHSVTTGGTKPEFEVHLNGEP